MSVAPTRRRVAPALALAAFLLTACSPTSPTPAPTATTPPAATPTQAPVEPPVVSGIVVGGSGFTTVDAAGAVVDTVPYSSDPAAAIALLSGLFDAEPLVSAVPEEHCSPSFNRADWDGAVKLDTDFAWLPEGQLFVFGAYAPSHAGIDLTTSGGLAVGDDASELIASLPPTHVEMYEYEGITQGMAAYEVEGGDFGPASYDAWGAQVRVKGSLVDGIVSPAIFLAASIC